MDQVVFSFSCGSRAGLAFNCPAVFHEPQDNSKIIVIFSAKSTSPAEVVEVVTGHLVGDSSMARLEKFCDLFCKFFVKFAESPCASPDREEKNAKLVDLQAVKQNWSFPTTLV